VLGKGSGFELLGRPQYSALWPLMLLVYLPEFAILLFMTTWFYHRTGEAHCGAGLRPVPAVPPFRDSISVSNGAHLQAVPVVLTHAYPVRSEGNMKRVIVVTDSTAGLPADLAAQAGLRVIPLWVYFGEQGYRDGVDITTEQFYPMLAKSKKLPTTSQPSAGEFVEFYRSLAGEAEAIVSIHISAELSGTVASAQAARDMMADLPVHVVDSRSASMGLGLIALAAARAAAAGQSAEQVAALAERIVPRMNIVFVVDTLEYLHKGGRIGGASAFLGSLIQIKPILQLEKGRIEALEKVRSRQKAIDRLLEILSERAGSGVPVRAALIHAQAPGEAEALRERMAGKYSFDELYVAGLSPAIGTHTGPGTIGAGFYTDE
jgi:DegV family protein with EDD domain